ncbi:unnamed protein product [Menidia menidia]|uniref:(Atlantic silverside) hypothetical protein n=1 Tax=Menidia menidia TaxID=238744 RepID=A0A8S4ANR5_9TELE|nr:unnamed protein product [Menidia menidia]
MLAVLSAMGVNTVFVTIAHILPMIGGNFDHVKLKDTPETDQFNKEDSHCVAQGVLMMSPPPGHIICYLNQKPWLNTEVRTLLGAGDAVFRAGEALALREAREGLTAGKGGPKPHTPRKFGATLPPAIPSSMWKSIKCRAYYNLSHHLVPLHIMMQRKGPPDRERRTQTVLAPPYRQAPEEHSEQNHEAQKPFLP